MFRQTLNKQKSFWSNCERLEEKYKANMNEMRKYFKKFGLGWLVAGFILTVIVGGFDVLISSGNIDQMIKAIRIGFFFIFCLFFAGFLGYLRFFLWVFSWEILYVLNGLVDKFIFRAGANGTEYLGPVMLLAMPLFLIIGVVDEILYQIRSRKIKSEHE